MSGRGLILAAHGSRYEPAVNAQIRGYAESIAQTRLFEEVGVAFHQGHPTFADAVDQLHATDLIVVPVMTSAGYYSDLVLPRELQRSRRYSQVRLRQTIPLGLHPRMSELVNNRLDATSSLHGLKREDTAIAIVGHGTLRHPGSRSSTETLAAALGGLEKWPQVFAAFIDEEPAVETVCARANHANLVVIPFLIGAGPHAVDDIPARLDLPRKGKGRLPRLGVVGGRTVLCDAPVGSDPRVVDLIVDLATAADLEQRLNRHKVVA
jgi:sirohydrochlorin cobaltochelatase